MDPTLDGDGQSDAESVASLSSANDPPLTNGPSRIASVVSTGVIIRDCVLVGAPRCMDVAIRLRLASNPANEGKRHLGAARSRIEAEASQRPGGIAVFPDQLGI